MDQVGFEASQSSPSSRQEGFWMTLTGAVREMPWYLRIVLVFFLGFVVALPALFVIGKVLAGGAERVAVLLILAGIAIAFFGEALLISSHNRGRPWFSIGMKAGFASMTPTRFHRMQLAYPVLAVLAGICLGGGLTLTLANGFQIEPSTLVVAPYVLLGCLFLGWILFTVARNSRFIYTQARTQSEAKLALLQSQLNPHFLFNALNTVAALVRTDAKAAEVAVEDVARVLRRTLDRSQRSLAPLAEEVDYLKAYLAIEEQRWGERLRVMWEIRPDTLELPVPPLCLQPLVENALKHGLSEKLGGGTVTIAAAIQHGRLSLWTRDDGIGLGKNWQEGTGLSNLRERLLSIYGSEATLYLRDAEPGVWAVVTLPLASRS